MVHDRSFVSGVSWLHQLEGLEPGPHGRVVRLQEAPARQSAGCGEVVETNGLLNAMSRAAGGRISVIFSTSSSFEGVASSSAGSKGSRSRPSGSRVSVPLKTGPMSGSLPDIARGSAAGGGELLISDKTAVLPGCLL